MTVKNSPYLQIWEQIWISKIILREETSEPWLDRQYGKIIKTPCLRSIHNFNRFLSCKKLKHDWNIIFFRTVIIKFYTTCRLSAFSHIQKYMYVIPHSFRLSVQDASTKKSTDIHFNNQYQKSLHTDSCAADVCVSWQDISPISTDSWLASLPEGRDRLNSQIYTLFCQLPGLHLSSW